MKNLRKTHTVPLVPRTQPPFFLALTLTFFLSPFLFPLHLEASFLDPSLSYQTTRTDHFRIHHAVELTSIAERVAEFTEEAYRVIGEEFQVYPVGPVQVLLVDQYDKANGFATVLPYNLIILHVAPPDADSNLAFYDDWLRLLVLHEYAHIVHLSDAGYPAKLVKFLFGKLVAPNALSPSWVTEGLATYYETELTQGGRGRSTYKEMLLRTDVLNDEFLAIDQAAGTMYDWPSYQAPYLYGVAFWQYLAEKYGKETLTTFSHKYGASLWFFSLNNKAKRVFGKSFYKLWKEWKQSLKEKYLPLKENIEEEGLENGIPLLGEKGESLTRPTWSPDGNSLVYVSSSVDRKTEVRLRSDEEDRLLFDDYVPSQLAWSPDGSQLAFTAFKTHKRYYRYYDLFLFNLETKKTETLTQGKRVRDPTFSPDGKKIAVSLHEKGRDRLALFDIETKELHGVNNPPRDTRIDHLTWSPYGDRIAASVWQPGRGRNIVVYDTSGKVLRHITENDATERHPVWDPHEDFLYYVSDRSGIFNIYRYDWNRKEHAQISRVLTGTFRPSPAGDSQSLVYQYYTGKGYAIRLIHNFPIGATGGPPKAGTARLSTSGGSPPEADETTGPVAPEDEPVNKEGIVTKPYSLWSTALLPHYIRPDLVFMDNAIFAAATIGSSDPLFRHHWYARGTYRTDAQFLGFGIGYSYSRYLPTFNIGYSDYVVNFGNFFGTGNDFFEERRRAFAGASCPLGGGHRISSYYFFEDRSAESAIPATATTTPVLGRYAGLSLQYIWNMRRGYPASISPEESYWLRANVLFTNSFLGASQRMEQTVLSADARQYIKLPWSKHHVLALRQAGGVALGDRLTQGTFGLGGSLGESILAGTSTRTFTLRGLPLTTFVRDRALVFSAEYRIPLFSPQRGLGTLPLALNKASMAIFADYGNAWNAGQAPGGLNFFDPFMLGVGIELRGHFVIGYHLPIMGRLGYGIIVVNRNRVANLSDPILGQSISNGILILELGTSF